MNKLSAIFLISILFLSIGTIYATPTNTEYEGDWVTVTFTEVGSDVFVIPNGVTEVEVLVVGGGGSGGSGPWTPGGGGAGGLIFMDGENLYEFNTTELSNGYVSLIVGNGGEAVYSNHGNNGENSVFGHLTALGGGGGGWSAAESGYSGGSGGGRSSGGGYVGSGLQPSQPGDSGTYGWGSPGSQPWGGGAGRRDGIHTFSGKEIWGKIYSAGWESSPGPNTGHGGKSNWTNGYSDAGGSGIVIVRYISKSPASLSSSITASPSTVVQGNTITVTMTVSNSGDSTATNVVPSALDKTGTGDAAFASGPTPSSRTIAGHSEANFTWTYTAGDVGTVTFSGNASADGGLSSSSTDSNEVTIYIPNGAPYVIENFDERGVKKSEIVIPYTLYDGESDLCSITFEYYYGGNWYLATEGLGSDGKLGLSSSPSGEPHIFVWDSRKDAPNLILHKTKIRIKPEDGLLDGPWIETEIFNVNNKRPDPNAIFSPIANARLKAVKELLAIIEPKLPEMPTDEIEKMMDQVYIHIENASNSKDDVYISSELNKAKKLLEDIQKILNIT